jgi:hypothetical protein
MLINILILIILVIASYFAAMHFAYDEGKKHYSDNDITLPDIGFRVLKDKRSSNKMYDIKESIFITYLILFIFLIRENKTALYEFALSVLIILFLKNILFVSTILPDPSKRCQRASLSKLHKGGCYDLVISSHCVLLFVSLFVILKHCNYNTLTISTVIGIQMLIIYCILALRQHYTTDILNAFFYSFLVCKWVQNDNIFSFIK